MPNDLHHTTELYRQAARDRDTYLRALKALCRVPNITVAEHAEEDPWLAHILHRIKTTE